MGTHRTDRRSIDVNVPAHVTFERICRVEEYPRFRAGVRAVHALSETRHRWELAVHAFTARLDERRPDALLSWHSIDGAACGETLSVRPLSPRRSRLTVETTGPRHLIGQIAADLVAFKRLVERDHPPVGHHVNERAFTPARNRPNWRESRLNGRTSTGEQHFP